MPNLCDFDTGTKIKIVKCKDYPYLEGTIAYVIGPTTISWKDESEWKSASNKLPGWCPWNLHDQPGFLFGWHVGHYTEVELVKENTNNGIVSKNKIIYSCISCKTSNPYAEPNMADGTYKCYSCRP